MPTLETLFLRFGLALFLGFLIGLERERDNPFIFAGMRTFSLISLMGATLAFISDQFLDSWMFIIGFLVVSTFALASYVSSYQPGQQGITTEVVSLMALLLGALVYWNMLTLAAAITVVIVFILNFKPNLKKFLNRVDRQDIWAGIEFAVVWVVILPILPNEAFGPFNVLNPREIWLMVVLVAGINLAGYVLSQVYGAERSIGLTGVLGGLISSTALTFNFARRSSSPEEKRYATMFAFSIAIASTGMYLRVLILTAITNPELSLKLLPSMLIGAVVVGLGDFLIWNQIRKKSLTPEDSPRGKRSRSPFALKPALQFGLIFAGILFLSAAAQEYFGDAGSYVSSIIGGSAGLDAVALTMAKLATNGTIPVSVAAKSVALGAATNMLLKGSVAWVLGKDEVRNQILPLFALAAAATVASAFLI